METIGTQPGSMRRTLLRSPLVAGLMAVAGGLAVGWLLLKVGPAKTGGVLLAVGGLALVVRSIWLAYAGLLAVLCLLPFAVLPLSNSPLTPTLLELALLAGLGGYLVILLVDRRQQLRVGAPQALWVGLLGVSGAALVLGAGRGYTTATLHDFFKFVLAMGAFVLTIQLVTQLRYAIWVVRGLLAGTSAAALLGLVLYVGGPGLTLRVLARLIPYGYPSGRIVRYIEDDPARPMRAVGTAVDPNSFGGLLMVGFVLAAGALLVGPRLAPRWTAWGALGLTGAAMLLTYSRGAWVGAFVGLLVLFWFLDRRWFVPLGLLGVIGVVVGVGSGFVERLWLGFTLQDPATKLRLQEYENALAIIREHPWFGVGFGDAPSIELQVGVSSIYLTIAEQAGLVGLVIFLATVAAVLWRPLGVAFRRSRPPAERPLVVVVLAAFLAALAVGLVDHYFFNIRFAHMAALFWTLAGLLVALTSPPVSEAEEGNRHGGTAT